MKKFFINKLIKTDTKLVSINNWESNVLHSKSKKKYIKTPTN